MQVNDLIFKELIKRGYSLEGKTRVWNVSDSKLWYLTPELAKSYLKLKSYKPQKQHIDDEIKLIQANSSKITHNFGKTKFNLVDLGCGDGLKAEKFIQSLPGVVKIRYCPVDISKFFLDESVRRIGSMKSKIVDKIDLTKADFVEEPYVMSAFRSNEYQSNMILLLGETISHYDIHEVLFKISQNMLPGDMLVIGNGIRTGKRFVNLPKYKAPVFHEWFMQILNQLGFKNDEVEGDVRFKHGRLEGYYRTLVDKSITSRGRTVYFQKGDELIIAIQYKFFENELKKYCSMYFPKVEIFSNSDSEYCLAVC